jgi:MFS-type transporter involved in bile tolerance (Atg22 family)
MMEEDLEAKSKSAADLPRLVFVCAMWITGFDLPTCSTVNHRQADEEEFRASRCSGLPKRNKARQN